MTKSAQVIDLLQLQPYKAFMYKVKRPLPKPLRVRVPASTSNLGPGFDLLGLTLSLWIEVTLEDVTKDGVVSYSSRTGMAQSWPKKEGDLVVQAIRKVTGKEFGMQLAAHSNVPIARGLGSSGAAVAAGLLLGNALRTAPLALDDLHALGIALEGHPDNVTASLFGGLTLCHPSAGPDKSALLVQAPIHGELEGAVAWTDATLTTQAARQVLPQSVAFSDAAENPRRLALLLEGLRCMDPVLIRAGLVDCLHERFRLPLIRSGEAALAAAIKAGAFGACVSGSGSALFALGRRGEMESVGQAMQCALSADNPVAEYRVVQVVRGVPRVQVVDSPSP